MSTRMPYCRTRRNRHQFTDEPGRTEYRPISYRRFCVVPASREALLDEIRRLYRDLRDEVDLSGLSLSEIGLVDRKGILEVRFYFASACVYHGMSPS